MEPLAPSPMRSLQSYGALLAEPYSSDAFWFTCTMAHGPWLASHLAQCVSVTVSCNALEDMPKATQKLLEAPYSVAFWVCQTLCIHAGLARTRVVHP
jgi:hypothetical protein